MVVLEWHLVFGPKESNDAYRISPESDINVYKVPLTIIPLQRTMGIFVNHTSEPDEKYKSTDDCNRRTIQI